MCSRYHLCFAALSQGRPHAVPSHGRAVTGAPGARLLGSWAVGVPAPRCIRRRPLSPFHRARGSLCSIVAGTPPLPRCIRAGLYRIRAQMSRVSGRKGPPPESAPALTPCPAGAVRPISKSSPQSPAKYPSSASAKPTGGAPPLFLEKSRGAGLSAPGPYSPFSSATSASVKYRHCPGGRSPSSRVCSRTRRSRLTFRSHRAHMRRICRFFPS